MFVAQQDYHDKSSFRQVSLRRTSNGLKRDVLVQRTQTKYLRIQIYLQIASIDKEDNQDR